jgi:putative spermidine/putrescine transport system ATP-binding protein
MSRRLTPAGPRAVTGQPAAIHRPVTYRSTCLVRPESLRMTAVPNGDGIVTIATFLGSLTRVSVLLPGDVTVQVDQPSAEAAAMPPGTSVQVSVAEAPVLVTTRR